MSILIAPVRATFFLITIASVSVILPTVISRDRQPFDPFAAYADILPGQSPDVIEQRGFTCSSSYEVASINQACSLASEVGVFSEIQVLIASDTGLVNRVIFKPRKKMLTLGDLVLLWGKPEIAIYARTANLRWRDMRVVAVPQIYNGHFSYWLPITYVAFESAN